MRYLKELALILGFSAQSVLADLPHSFKAGTPARASEVNDNFSYLQERIETLEQAHKESVSYECNDTDFEFQFTYDFEGLPLGTPIYVGGSEYRIIKYLVTDPKTNQKFHITIPQLVYSVTNPEPISFVAFQAYTYPIQDERFVCGSAFGDANLYYDETIGFKINTVTAYSNDGIDSAGSYNTYRDNVSVRTLSISFHIAFGSQYMPVYMGKMLDYGEVIVSKEDYDFTDDTPELPDTDASELLNEITRYLNNIRIEEVQ